MRVPFFYELRFELRGIPQGAPLQHSDRALYAMYARKNAFGSDCTAGWANTEMGIVRMSEQQGYSPAVSSSEPVVEPPTADTGVATGWRCFDWMLRGAA